MGGPNLEIFKFGFYLFTPIYVMLKFGDPDWYDAHVVPMKEVFWPPYETTHQPPKTHAAIKEELARLKLERRAKKEQLHSGDQMEQPSLAESVPRAGGSEARGEGEQWKWASGSGRVV